MAKRRNYTASEVRRLSAAFILALIDRAVAEPKEGCIESSELAPLCHLVGLTNDDLAAVRRDLNRHRAKLEATAGSIAGEAYRDMPAILAAERE